MAIGAKWLSVAGALGLVLGMAGAADAGPGRKGPEGVKARVERMKENLGLSDEQAHKIEAILTDAVNRGQAERSQARENRRQVHEQIQAVLTEEQKAKAAEHRQQRRHRRPEGTAPAPEKPPQS